MSELQLSKSDTEVLPISCQTQSDRQLLIDSKQFAHECRLTSWRQLLTTIVVLSLLVGAVFVVPNLLPKVLASGLIGLTLVRLFILYHDYLHSSIFSNSWLAGFLLKTYGNLMLCPPSIWKRSHDYHHRNNCKIHGANIGSFPIMTVDCYRKASNWQRAKYRFERHYLGIIFGYITVFLVGMCLYPMLKDVKRGFAGLWAMILHFGLIGLLVYQFGWSQTILVFIAPTAMAMGMGTYLFYIQHNFPGGKIRLPHDWTYQDAALCSSSYLELGSVMQWFTGNIGFHHVHHLNAKIPFYRLPQAMAGLPGLQMPTKTTLSLKDIAACLKLKLWDVQGDHFVPFEKSLR